jgi:hypothetical protein
MTVVDGLREIDRPVLTEEDNLIVVAHGTVSSLLVGEHKDRSDYWRAQTAGGLQEQQKGISTAKLKPIPAD